VDALFLLGQTLLQSLVLCAVFIALYDIAKSTSHLDGLVTLSAAVVLLGVLGYLAFWLAYASYAVFGVVKIAVLALLLVRLAFVIYGRRLMSHLSWLGEPLLYVFLFFLIVLTLGFSNGGTDLPHQTAARRFGYELPVDNLISMIVADALKLGRIASPLYSDWLSSDRPPLQTGLYLLLTIRTGELGYQIVASWLQATFLFGVWGLGVAAALPTAARRLVLLACCLLPPAILNTFYVWPKLLAVGYLLLAFALVFRRRSSDEPSGVTGAIIGGLAALALLSHGSAAFALIGFAVTVLVFWAWPPLKTMLYGAATVLLLYVPWIFYQQVIDPPGNRLLKWHLAGAVDIDSRGFLTTLREGYGALSWHDYLAGKLENVKVMIGTWPANLMEIARLIVGRDADVAPAIRIADFFQFLPSLHVFALALIVALALLAFMRADERPQRDFALRMIVALAATCVGFVILIFIPGQTINHVGTYATQVMATAFAVTVLALRAPVLALSFIAVQAVTVSAAYAFALPHDPKFWPVLAVCVAATVALFVYSLSPIVTRGAGAATAARR
jgi:hypothetical protein